MLQNQKTFLCQHAVTSKQLHTWSFWGVTLELKMRSKASGALPPGKVQVMQMKHTYILYWYLVPPDSHEKISKSETLVMSVFWIRDAQIMYPIHKFQHFSLFYSYFHVHYANSFFKVSCSASHTFFLSPRHPTHSSFSYLLFPLSFLPYLSPLIS